MNELEIELKKYSIGDIIRYYYENKLFINDRRV